MSKWEDPDARAWEDYEICEKKIMKEPFQDKGVAVSYSYSTCDFNSDDDGGYNSDDDWVTPDISPKEEEEARLCGCPICKNIKHPCTGDGRCGTCVEFTWEQGRCYVVDPNASGDGIENTHTVCVKKTKAREK